MKDACRRAAAKVSQEEIFRALSYAALKARAGHLDRGTIIKIGSFEMLVAEDEEGDGIVVQTIVPRMQIEILALAGEGELDAPDGRKQDKEEWLALFLVELRAVLEKWQSIEIRQGPGENLTFSRHL